MGGAVSAQEVDELQCANGKLHKGDRVKTHWSVDEGGDGQWYAGTAEKLTGDGCCKIKYDDGDAWKGDARVVYLSTPQANQQGQPGHAALVGNVEQITRSLCSTFSAFSQGQALLNQQQAATALYHLGQAPRSMQEFAQAFAVLDKNGDGYISLPEEAPTQAW